MASSLNRQTHEFPCMSKQVKKLVHEQCGGDPAILAKFLDITVEEAERLSSARYQLRPVEISIISRVFQVSREWLTSGSGVPELASETSTSRLLSLILRRPDLPEYLVADAEEVFDELAQNDESIRKKVVNFHRSGWNERRILKQLTDVSPSHFGGKKISRKIIRRIIKESGQQPEFFRNPFETTPSAALASADLLHTGIEF